MIKKTLVQMSLLLGVAMFTGCGSSDSEKCETFQKCGNYDLSACCSGSQCRYKSSDGKEFACNGTSCESAAQKAVEWCMAQ